MKITKSQLKSLIKEEVSRFKKIHILENRKRKVQRELRMLNENDNAYISLDDDFLASDRDSEMNEKLFDALDKMFSGEFFQEREFNKFDDWHKKSYATHALQAHIDSIVEPYGLPTSHFSLFEIEGIPSRRIFENLDSEQKFTFLKYTQKFDNFIEQNKIENIYELKEMLKDKKSSSKTNKEHEMYDQMIEFIEKIVLV